LALYWALDRVPEVPCEELGLGSMVKKEISIALENIILPPYTLPWSASPEQVARRSIIQWLRDKKIVIGSNSDKRTIQHVIHHWKTSGGEILQKYNKSTSN
jgi:hypothetical protein